MSLAKALMYVCAISRVSILDIFCSLLRLGTTSLSLSKASLSPFILFLSLALAASRRCLSMVGDGGCRFFFLPPLPFLCCCCCCCCGWVLVVVVLNCSKLVT